VAARRADAALEGIAELYPKAKRARWKRRLRKIRRSAGELRDLDVLLGRYREQGEGVPTGTLARLESQRQEGAPAIEKLARRWRKQRCGRRARKLVSKIRWRGEEPEPTILDAARRWLGPACDRFLAAAAAQPGDPESLHRLRIRGKELRYAMEIFALALPDFFREELYSAIETLQEHLGRINDHATAEQRFLRWERKGKGASEGLPEGQYELAAQHERAQLDQAIDVFRQWWTTQRAEAFRARFAEALAAP
jgi:CHAD domain-containing protein